MIKVIKSNRSNCNACFDREPEKAYEIRFGNSRVSDVSVIIVCGVCLMAMKREIGEVNFSE